MVYSARYINVVQSLCTSRALISSVQDAVYANLDSAGIMA